MKKGLLLTVLILSMINSVFAVPITGKVIELSAKEFLVTETIVIEPDMDTSCYGPECFVSSSECGNGVCEAGERPFCPDGMGACSRGTCPEDCPLVDLDDVNKGGPVLRGNMSDSVPPNPGTQTAIGTVIKPCPLYMPPAKDWCEDGKIIPGVWYGNGCLGPAKCILPGEIIECPEFVPPASDWCEDGEVLPGEVDENGCQGPAKCVLPTHGEEIICPLFMPPVENWCEDGEVIQSSDDNGCQLPPRCVLPTQTGKVPCPLYMPPAEGWCKEGKLIEASVDENGCQGPAKCIPSTFTCPAGCVCENKQISCPSSESVEVEILTPVGIKTISVEKVSESAIAIRDGQTLIRTAKKLVVDEKRLLMETATGRKEIKIMPSVASETAINQLKLNNFEIELKDVGKPVYEVTGKREVKLFGLFRRSMQVRSQISAETGIIERTDKPWWSFLAREI